MKIGCYNILSGGFNSYTYNYQNPDRLNLLKQAIGEINADYIGLVDTFRWKDLYSDKDLERIFNYKTTFHIDMNDTRVDKKIGITVMTNLPVKQFKKIRLYNRDCIKVTIKDNKNLVDIFTVYLDDFSEDTRLKEIKALLKEIDSDLSVIMGDINAIATEDVEGANKNYHDFLLQKPDFVKTKEYKTYFKPAFRNLLKVEVIDLIKSKGFNEANNKYAKLPTAPTKLHPLNTKKALARVDHIFVTPGLKISNFKVHSGNLFENASDHFPISADIV